MDEATATAVLNLVNAGDLAEIEQVLRTQQQLLLTDDADQVMLHLLGQYREDADAVGHLRLARALLHTARELGTDRALATRRALLGDVARHVVEYVNHVREGTAFDYVRTHQELLLSPEASRVLRFLAAQYPDDPVLAGHLADCRERLETVRAEGLVAAFGDTHFIVSEKVAEAVSVFTQVPYNQLREVLERDSELLLTDEAEAFLDFILSNAENAPDHPMLAQLRERLSLIRRCRARGIAGMFGRPLPDLVPEGAGEGAPPALLEDELDRELTEIGAPGGSVRADDMRTLLDRRPELADVLRSRFDTGDALWLEGRDYTFAGQMTDEMNQAWQHSDWERVSTLAEEALTRFTRDEEPFFWAALHSVAGTGRSRLPHGDRAENLELAISHHLLAREVFKPDRAVGWESNEHHLALAYLQRVRDDHTANVETAVDILRELLEATREARPEWQLSYADALRQRVRGGKAENLELAAAVLRSCAERPDVSADAWLRSRTALGLGMVLLERSTIGDASDSEQAIALLAETVPRLDPAEDIISWVHCHRSLATAYLRRSAGDPAENWAAALDLLVRISAVCPAERYPELWAENQLAIAHLLTSHPEELTEDLVRRAVDAMESTLTVYSRHGFPERWAKVHVNLGNLHGLLILTGDEDAATRAIDHLEHAFEVYTREGNPLRWAIIHSTLGTVGRRRAASAPDPKASTDLAIEHFRRALEVRTAETDPAGCLDTLKNLSEIHFDGRQWAEALAVCVDAMRASDELLGGMYSDAGRLSVAGNSDWIHDRAAYCLFRLNDGHAAVACAEWGRARTLAQALALRDLDLTELPPERRERVATLRHRIRSLEATLRDDDVAGTAIDSLRAARQELAAATDRLQSRLRMGQMVQAIPPGGAIVLPVVTPAGAVIYCLHGSDQDRPTLLQLNVSWLTTDRLDALLHGKPGVTGWIPLYREWRAGRVGDADWRSFLRQHLAALGSLLAEPIESALGPYLPDQAPITIVPSGSLSFLPLHAAGAMLDRFVVSYAPSVYALRTSARRLESNPDSSLFAVADPTSDLPFARLEGEYLRRMSGTVLFEDATEEAVRDAVSRHTHLHFACHGVHSPEDALRSGIRLSGWDLGLRTLLAPGFDLGHVRLVTLSACETGLIDTRYPPDEFIGLPTGFLQGGACGVISTLWPVNDVATAVLMARFYRDHLSGGVSPAVALHGAQQWLRDATTAAISAFLTECEIAGTVAGEPGERPFADPYYWAAFQFTGA